MVFYFFGSGRGLLGEPSPLINQNSGNDLPKAFLKRLNGHLKSEEGFICQRRWRRSKRSFWEERIFILLYPWWSRKKPKFHRIRHSGESRNPVISRCCGPRLSPGWRL